MREPLCPSPAAGARGSAWLCRRGSSPPARTPSHWLPQFPTLGQAPASPHRLKPPPHCPCCASVSVMLSARLPSTVVLLCPRALQPSCLRCHFEAAVHPPPQRSLMLSTSAPSGHPLWCCSHSQLQKPSSVKSPLAKSRTGLISPSAAGSGPCLPLQPLLLRLFLAYSLAHLRASRLCSPTSGPLHIPFSLLEVPLLDT